MWQCLQVHSVRYTLWASEKRCKVWVGKGGMKLRLERRSKLRNGENSRTTANCKLRHETEFCNSTFRFFESPLSHSWVESQSIPLIFVATKSFLLFFEYFSFAISFQLQSQGLEMSSPVHSVSVAWCLWNFHFPSSPSCLLIPFALSFPSCDEYHMMGGGRVVRDLGRKRERDHDDHRIGMKLSNYIPWLIPNRFHIHFQFYNFTVFVSVSLILPLLLEFLILSSPSPYFLLPNSSFSSIPVHFCLFLPQPSHASLTWWSFMISIVRRDRKLWNCSILICNGEGKICERGAKINCGNVYVRKNRERERERWKVRLEREKRKVVE